MSPSIEILRHGEPVIWEQCVPQSRVRGDREWKTLLNMGYGSVMTELFAKGVFPEVPSGHILYTRDRQTPCVYFNPTSFAVCRLDSAAFLRGDDGAEEAGWDSICSAESDAAQGIFHPMCLPDGMRLDYLIRLLNGKSEKECPGFYRLFIDTYLNSSFSLRPLSAPELRRIIGRKTAQDKRMAAKYLPADGCVSVIRGEREEPAAMPSICAWYVNRDLGSVYANVSAMEDPEYGGWLVEAQCPMDAVYDIFPGKNGELHVLLNARELRDMRVFTMMSNSALGALFMGAAAEARDYLAVLRNLDYRSDEVREHAAFILLFALMLGASAELPARLSESLAFAAIYADTADDASAAGIGHGAKALDYYHTVSPSANLMTEYLISEHDAANPAAPPASLDPAEANLVLSILRDADRLEQIRSRDQLDISHSQFDDVERGVGFMAFARELKGKTLLS